MQDIGQWVGALQSTCCYTSKRSRAIVLSYVTLRCETFKRTCCRRAVYTISVRAARSAVCEHEKKAAGTYTNNNIQQLL